MRPLARRGPFTLTWPVIAVAAVTVLAVEPFVSDWATWPRWLASDPAGFGSWVVSTLIPRLALPLVGAALFLRHPDAHRRLPLLVMGAGLLAIEPLVTRGARWLVDTLVVGSGGGFHSTTSASMVVVLLAGLSSAFGFAYLGRGLAATRQYEDRGSVRWLVVLVLGTAIAWGALTTVAAASLPAVGDRIEGPVLIALWAMGAVASVVAGGYLAIIATRGAQAGERGRRAWTLATVGAWGILLAPLAMGVISVGWSVPGLASELTSAAYQVLALVSSAAHILFLLAFLDGLPDDEGITWFDLAELDAPQPRPGND